MDDAPSLACKPKPSASLGRGALRAVEFFAGIGLVRLACERRGIEVVFANDHDPKKFSIYRDNFGDDHFHLGDINQLPSEAIPHAELYTASFPCNDLSIAGAMAGLQGAESGAFWGLIRILKEKIARDAAPNLVLLENVPGFLISNGGNDLHTALVALNQLDYRVDLLQVDAVHFTPQSRARLFVVASRFSPKQYPFGLLQTSARPAPLVQFILAHPDIDWNVASLPAFPRRENQLNDVLEDLADDDPTWWTDERRTYFLGQLSPAHADEAKRMTDGNMYQFATAFRRVRKGRSMAEIRVDGVAGCLRTPRGGSGRQILLKAGKGRSQVRLLTARECARLQGVPDSFVIRAPLNQALFGFGDAVCVPVVEWVLQHAVMPRLMDEIRSQG